MLRARAGVCDQGAKLVSAIASIVDSQDPDEIASVMSQIPDVMGYAYRFGLPSATIPRTVRSV